MNVAEAQREMRDVYLDVGPGEAVAGAVWLVSAALATWVSRTAGVLALVFGGMLIFPLSQLILHLLGHRTSVSSTNPLRELAPQVAFIVPILMPLAGAAMLHRASWFYPAFMVIVGAHYLPFAFLYGTRRFLVLAAALVAAGFSLALGPFRSFSAGAWLTAVVLFAFAGWGAVRRGRAAA